MYKRVLFLLVSLFCLAQAAWADENVFSLSSYKYRQGETSTVLVQLDAADAYGGFQFDLYLPQGVSVITTGKNDKPRVYENGPWGEDDLALSCTRQTTGAYRFILYANVGAEKPKAGSGYILEIKLSADSDAPIGPAKVQFKNTRVSPVDGSTAIKYPDAEFDAMVTAYFAISAASADEVMGSVELTGGGDAVEYGSEVTATATPNAGYEFVNWTAGDAEVSAENPYSFTATRHLSLLGNFKAKSYEVRFVFANGADDVVQMLPYGSSITKPDDPTRVGYQFAGWSPAFTDDATVPIDGVTYTAQWTINQYTITFDTDGGSAVESITQDYNSEVVAPANPTREGYTFAGWEPALPSVIPASNLTVKALWTINQYTITFDTDGGSAIESITQDYDSEVVAPANPTREGYTFAGWEPALPATVPATDLTVKALWTINQYTITFDTDGGSAVESITQDYNSEVVAPANPTREGYTFAGWEPALPSVIPASDLTVKALWTINQYTITFDTDGGSAIESITQDYNSEVVAPADPTREGYTFAGWDPELPSVIPASDLTVKALWTVNTYKLTYLVDGETYREYEIDYGTALTPEASPEKEGYTFSGWSDVPATMPAHDVTVEGTFSINTYKAVFKVGEDVIATLDVVYGDPVVAPEAPAREGYTFAGWQDVPETMPARDIEVLGSYTANIYKLTYLVDGETYKELEVAYGTALTPEASPEKEGYTFSGWSVVPATMPAHDVTVTGTFSINTYKAVFKVGDEVIATLEFVYGSPVVAPEAPAREGYTFAGWQDVPETMPAHDIEVLGSYTANIYKLTYLVDGETYKELEVAYGTALTPEASPEKEGYTFSGWSDVPATMPAHNVTVEGTFSINTYKAVFKVGEEVIATLEFVYGSPVVAPEAPAREGYTFAGWQDVPATMPARDIEVLGSYTANIYKLTYLVDGETYKELEVAYGTALTPEASPEKEGYTFSGWSDVPATMPAHDVTVTGTFSINTYKAVFKVGEEVIATLEFVYGAPVVAPEAPAREGYTFAGWQDVPATMPARDIEVLGSYTANIYKLTYLVDGETYKELEVAYGTALTPEASPEKEGYTFSGWSVVPATMPAHDVTVTGTFSINTYKAVFKVGDEVIATLEFVYGSPVVAPEAPAREGYTFAGWQDVPETMPAHDIEVLGSYTANIYKLTYLVDGETYKELEVAYGTALTPEASPEKEGYTFSGWSDVPATMPAHDVTVEGTFSINTYKAVFKVGDEVIATLDVVYGSPVVAPEAPAREGYTFAGWQDVPETMPAHDIEVLGSYTANIYKLTYLVDGETYKELEVAYGTALTPEASPEKEGYTFSGWSDVPATMPAHDVTVEGTFSINTYKAVFKVGDEVIATLDVVYGSPVVAPEAPAREGYTFAGWQDVPETMPAHDIEVLGSYTANIYKLTYLVDGETYKELEVAYGTALTPEASPEKEGYTFSGWSEVPATMPALDVTVTGTFSVNSYYLRLYLDGELYSEELVAYGTPIVLEDPELAEGIIFEGWQDVPETMPAHDVDIFGTTHDVTAIQSVVADDGYVTVYTLSGRLLYQNESWSSVRRKLPRGSYIINGRKCMIRK